jgi:hypothetical protein
MDNKCLKIKNEEMKYVKSFESINWEKWEEEEEKEDGVIVGDLVKTKGLVYYYTSSGEKINVYLKPRSRVYRVNNKKIKNNEVLIKLEGHWPWFIFDYFRVVDKSYEKYL